MLLDRDLHLLFERLDKIDATLQLLIEQRTVKDWYGTDEVAALLDKAEFTVREWCRLGRVRCQKKLSGRGKFLSWAIAHEELLRIQREGLLPLENPFAVPRTSLRA